MMKHDGNKFVHI